jgi:hypothetical protein
MFLYCSSNMETKSQANRSRLLRRWPIRRSQTERIHLRFIPRSAPGATSASRQAPINVTTNLAYDANARNEGTRAARSGAQGWRTFAAYVEQRIHVVADAITEVVADEANAVQTRDQNIAIRRRQLADDLESLFEHADECIEERFVLMAEVVAESGGALAVAALGLLICFRVLKSPEVASADIQPSCPNPCRAVPHLRSAGKASEDHKGFIGDTRKSFIFTLKSTNLRQIALTYRTPYAITNRNAN